MDGFLKNSKVEIMIKDLINSIISQPDVVGVAISQNMLIPFFIVDKKAINISTKLMTENNFASDS